MELDVLWNLLRADSWSASIIIGNDLFGANIKKLHRVLIPQRKHYRGDLLCILKRYSAISLQNQLHETQRNMLIVGFLFQEEFYAYS